MGGSADTINLPAGNYVLTMSNELVLSADTIVGVGARTTFIDGGDKTRVLRVAGEGTSRVSGVTIRNGNGASTTSNGAGGGIFLQSSTLMLTNVTVSGNSASDRRGHRGRGRVMTFMIGSTVSGNTAGTSRLHARRRHLRQHRRERAARQLDHQRQHRSRHPRPRRCVAGRRHLRRGQPDVAST